MAPHTLFVFLVCLLTLWEWEGHGAATGHRRATGVREPLTRERRLSSVQGAVHADESRGLGGGSVSRRGLAPVRGAVHAEDAAVLLEVAAQWEWNSDITVATPSGLPFFQSTWDVRRPCAKWYGVTCSRATGRVTALWLQAKRVWGFPGAPAGTSFSLAGPFPPQLGSLPELSSLILARNSLTGAFPDAWGALNKLSHLDLSNTALVGNASAAAGPVPLALCNLTSLTYLNLGGTKLTYPLPEEFASLSRLAWLDLSGFARFSLKNDAAHTPLRVLQHLSGSLKSLSLRQSKLRPEDLQPLSRFFLLEQLDLSGNAMGGAVPAWLESFASLASLDVSWNRLEGPLPAWLGALPRLARLAVRANRLAGQVPAELFNSPSLTRLDLSRNSLSLQGLTFGPNASALKFLDLSVTGLNGTIPDGLSSLSSLQSLSMPRNQLSGPVPAFLWTLPSLSRLDLSRNRLTAFGPASDLSGGAKGPTYIDLSFNQITGALPGALVGFDRVLNVASNLLSGPLPQSVLDLVGNRTLEAEGNYGPSGRPRAIPGYADISGNYFTGPCLNNGVMVVGLECNPQTVGEYACIDSVRAELRTVSGNCLQDCLECYREGLCTISGPSQRTGAQCARFCGADNPDGPCGGHGTCSLEGPNNTPTCSCSTGFVAPGSKPGTCVRSA